MKKVVCLAVIMLLVAGTIPVFAATSDSSKPKVCGITLPFQVIADTMTVGKARQKNQLIPLTGDIGTLQQASDAITQGSNVRGESLRAPKAPESMK